MVSTVVCLPRSCMVRCVGGQVVLNLSCSPYADSRNGCQWVGSPKVLAGRDGDQVKREGSVGLVLGTRR